MGTMCFALMVLMCAMLAKAPDSVLSGGLRMRGSEAERVVDLHGNHLLLRLERTTTGRDGLVVTEEHVAARGDGPAQPAVHSEQAALVVVLQEVLPRDVGVEEQGDA